MIELLAFAAALHIAAWSETPEQSWSAHVNPAHTAVQFRTVYRAKTDHGVSSDEYEHSIALADIPNRFRGLTAEQLLGDAARVHFQAVHDAGTLDYTGTAGGGNAAGDFSIIPSAQFAQTLQRRGMGTPPPEEQTELTLVGADYAYLDLLAKQGFENPDVRQFVRLYEHGVSPEYVNAMAALHLTPRTIEGIIRARDHGVGPEYARALQDLGYRGLSVEQLIRMRDHGVSAEFIKGFRGLGISPTPEDLVRLRDHGVSGDYVASLRRRGYTANLSVDELIRLRDHGI